MKRSGIFDKSGLEIREGDTIEIHTPWRDSQTHYGENIPFPTGSYTEPLEPGIKTERHVVRWGMGMFYVDGKEQKEWVETLWQILGKYETRNDLIEAFASSPKMWIDKDDPGADDLGYLLQFYPPNSEAELMRYVSGCEIVAVAEMEQDGNEVTL